MNGIRLLGEWAYQYHQMTEVGDGTGHWNIDLAMTNFKDIILEYCGDSSDEYDALISKFKDCVAAKQYDDAELVALKIQSLLVRAIEQKYPYI